MKQEFGDAPIEKEYYDKMVGIAKVLDNQFNGELKYPNKEVGFILLVFPFGEEEGRCNYISNGADRRDVVKLMEEQIKRFKADE